MYNISDATKRFITIIKELNDEILRIEGILNDDKPNPDKVKAMLKKESPLCFEKMDEDDEGCPDIHEIRGTGLLPNHEFRIFESVKPQWIKEIKP